MYRSLKIRVPKRKLLFVNNNALGCFYATSAPRSAGGKKTFFTIAIAATGAGLTLAYAKYDTNFRKSIEKVVPYSNTLFEALPDFPRSDKTKQQSISSPVPVEKFGQQKKAPPLTKSQDQTEITPVEPSLMSKRSDSSVKQDVSMKLDSNYLSVPKTDILNVESDTPRITKQLQGDKALSMESGSSTISDQHADSEELFKQLINNAETASKEAVLAQEEAIKAIRIRESKVYDAVEMSDKTSDEKLWKQVEDASADEKKAIHLAHKKTSKADGLVRNLKDKIEENRKTNRNGTKNIDLVFGAGVADRIEKRLKRGNAELHSAQFHSEAATEYKNLVLKYREEFQNELRIVLPKSVLKGQVLTEEELQILVDHAKRHIERLQRDLAKLKVFEKERISEALKAQQSDNEMYYDTQATQDMDLQKTRMEMSYLTELEFIKSEFEYEMRQQLRRQAAVHSDHLNEALSAQQQEMERKYSRQLEDRLLHQRGVFISEIYQSLSSLKEVEDFLTARVQLDETSKKVQSIWFACQSLKTALKSGKFGQPNPLGKHVAFIEAAAGGNNTFVTTVIAGIPPKAVERGIYTDEFLKQRFVRVKQSCRRVAMINESNPSLYQYFLSYLQSLLILDKVGVPKEELEGKVAVDPAQWDTFDILSRVSYCLQCDDMEQALRYANQLRGEPKKVAKDWISELRLSLETMQAIDCLVAYAASVGVQAHH